MLTSLICDSFTHIEGVNDSLDDGVGTGVHEGNAGLPEKSGVCRGAGEDYECAARARHTPGCSVPIDEEKENLADLYLSAGVLN